MNYSTKYLLAFFAVGLGACGLGDAAADMDAGNTNDGYLENTVKSACVSNHYTLDVLLERGGSSTFGCGSLVGTHCEMNVTDDRITFTTSESVDTSRIAQNCNADLRFISYTCTFHGPTLGERILAFRGYELEPGVDEGCFVEE